MHFSPQNLSHFMLFFPQNFDVQKPIFVKFLTFSMSGTTTWTVNSSNLSDQQILYYMGKLMKFVGLFWGLASNQVNYSESNGIYVMFLCDRCYECILERDKIQRVSRRNTFWRQIHQNSLELDLKLVKIEVKLLKDFYRLKCNFFWCELVGKTFLRENIRP